MDTLVRSKTLARSWWLLVVRGLAAIVFGVLTLVWPGRSLAALVLLFGAYSFIEGITSVVLAMKGAEGQTGAWILHGIVGIGAGIATFSYPGATAVALYVVIAIWAVATGVIELVVAARLRHYTGATVGMIVFAGGVSILFGGLLLALPSAGLVALVGTIAAMAIMSGIAWIAFGVRVHRPA